jgi:hypothetical protein
MKKRRVFLRLKEEQYEIRMRYEIDESTDMISFRKLVEVFCLYYTKNCAKIFPQLKRGLYEKYNRLV